MSEEDAGGAGNAKLLAGFMSGDSPCGCGGRYGGREGKEAGWEKAGAYPTRSNLVSYCDTEAGGGRTNLRLSAAVGVAPLLMEREGGRCGERMGGRERWPLFLVLDFFEAFPDDLRFLV